MHAAAVAFERAETQGLGAAQGRALWQELANTYQGTLECEFAPRWRGGSSLRASTDRSQYVTWSCGGTHYRRSDRHIAADGKDGAGLLVSLAGVLTVGQFDRVVRIGPGHAYPMTNAEPFVMEHGHDGRPIMFNFGSEVLPRRLFDQGPPGRAIDLRVGIGRTVLALVTSLIDDAGAMRPHEFDAVCDRLVDLYGYADDRQRAEPGRDRLAEVASDARAYVRRHLGDPELSVQTIAQALGWSPRQVQNALRHVGTTSRDLIRTERLEQARRLLLAGGGRLSITQVAADLGFASPSSFSRAFRDRFGQSPRSVVVRRAASTPPPVPLAGRGREPHLRQVTPNTGYTDEQLDLIAGYLEKTNNTF